MSEAAFNPLSAEGLSITPQPSGEVLRVKMTGAVEMRDPGELLNPYWTGLDEAARAKNLKRVEVDLRDVNFMNSSGILTLVRWITKAKTHAPDQAYKLVLQYDRNVTWQRTSIPTLAKLAPQIVEPAEVNS
ncbi:MAG TPA: hypothetical protein VGJ82_14785 [Thermoanaerobaculia bacterium]|jgi:hypothetical protein